MARKTSHKRPKKANNTYFSVTFCQEYCMVSNNSPLISSKILKETIAV